MKNKGKKILKICSIIGIIILAFMLVFQLGIFVLHKIEEELLSSYVVENVENESSIIDTSKLTVIYEDKDIHPNVGIYKVSEEYESEIKEKCEYGGDIVWITTSDREGVPVNTKTITVVDLYQKNIKAIDFEFACDLDDSVFGEYIGSYELYYSGKNETDGKAPNTIRKLYFIESHKGSNELQIE